MIEALSLIVLYCSDVDASLRFYERLGLSFVKEQHGAGPVHHSSQLGGLVLELYPTARHPSRVRLAVTVSDDDYVALQEALGQMSTEPEKALLFRDPDQNQIEITRTRNDVRELAPVLDVTGRASSTPAR